MYIYIYIYIMYIYIYIYIQTVSRRHVDVDLIVCWAASHHAERDVSTARCV